jgi:hypothetical protein
MVRLGEALYRSEAHCTICCELYGAGRKAQALLQAARPITDVLPWLETELRSYRSGLRGFTVAVAQVGAEVRRSAAPRTVRRALAGVSKARSALLHEVLGDESEGDIYRSSVAIALLDTAQVLYRDAVESEDLNTYQSAYADVSMAVSMLAGLIPPGAESDVGLLETAFVGVEPPPDLHSPDAIARAIERIGGHLRTEQGAISAVATAADSLATIERVLRDVDSSYLQGQAALAARLAASLFVRSFLPIADEVKAADPEGGGALYQLLGFDLRRAINDGAPARRITDLIERAFDLIHTAKESLSLGQSGSFDEPGRKTAQIG